MRTRTLALAALLLAGPSILAQACDGEVDKTPNYLPGDDATSNDISTEPDVAPDVPASACECLVVGNWFRFDQLQLVSVDGGDHPVIATLNPLWADDIEKLELNILFEITEVSADEMVVRGVNGARDPGGTFCVLEETAVEIRFPLDGCTLKASAPTQFNVYAGSKQFPKTCSQTLPVKHAIPISGAVLQANLEPGCTGFSFGFVPTGGLAESALNQLCTCITTGDDLSDVCGELDPNFADSDCPGCNNKYLPLGGLLQSFGALEWKCKDDAGGPAACIEANWAASALDVTPPTCSK